MRISQRMGRKERKLVETISIIDVDSPSPTSASMKAHSNLTKQEADMIKRGFLADSSMILVDFPRRRRSKRKIKSKNATAMQNKLDSGAFECYFQNLWRSFSEDKKTSFTYLDCLWFELHRKSAYKAKVLTWIQKKDIFSKKYVLVPIVCWRHWSLLIFCHFGESTKSETRTPCMLLLDSLEKANPRRLEPEIRKFVLDIYKAEGRLESKDSIYQIPLLVPKVPQQRNGEECGSFVLYFINLFMENAPEDFSTQHFPYFMKDNWFTPAFVDYEFMEETEEVIEKSSIHQRKDSKQDVSCAFESKQDAEKLAIELLATRAFTAVEMRKKLHGKRFSPDTVESVIDDFQRRGFINDSLYAETFSQSRWSSSSWGPRRIKQALLRKGVSEVDAENAVKLVFEKDESGDHESSLGLSKTSVDHLFIQASKQWLRGQDVPKEKRKSRIIRWLQYRGFNWGVISIILKKLESQHPP